MKKLTTGFAIWTLVFISSSLIAQNWTQIITDANNDAANASLLEGTALSYAYDQPSDSIWFKFNVTNLNANKTNWGMNLMINFTGGGSTFNFWGSDNSNAYHKLLTAWVTGTAPSSYTGTIGVANSTGVGAQNYTNVSSNNFALSVNTTTNEIIIGMKRVDLISDAEMGGNTITMNIAGAVGSSTSWNDDLYSASATITINKTALAVNNVKQASIDVYPNPVSELLTIKYQLASPKVSLVIYNTLGQEVQTRKTITPTTTLNIQDLEAGIYLLQLKEDGETIYSQQLLKR